MDIAVLIVNSIATLAAVIGLIITCSQFKKTMKAQNRSTDVSLFDLRMEILAYVEDKKMNFSRTRAQLLFGNEIYEKIKQYDCTIKECNKICRLRREFVELLQKKRADDTYEKATELLYKINQFDSTDPDSPQYQQLKEYIQKESFTGGWQYSNFPTKFKTLNYVDLKEQEVLFYSKAENLREEIITAMKKFIEKSIQ